MRAIRAVLRCLLIFAASAPAFAGELPAPDYHNDSSWAALPHRVGAAGETPAGIAKTPSGDVPVFFIHPTTDYSLITTNVEFDEGGVVAERLAAVLKFQASVFNACCEIYAPRYRQASLRAIVSNTPDAYAADEIAYGDVARAFAAFLQRIDKKPFIVAAHSQGSIHAIRLLQEKIVGTPLQKRLVAAYPIGGTLPVEIERLGLPICRSAAQTGCVVTWNSVRTGVDDPRRRTEAVIWWEHRYQPNAGRPLVCVNPLNWQFDGAAEASANLGGIYSVGHDKPIPPPVPAITGARCESGLLGVNVMGPQEEYYRDRLTPSGIYHVFDYGLFYMNIRANAAERIAAYQKLTH